ncbi:MAG: ArsR family transcriptional regulator [Chloroflexota bacterium]
MANLNTAREHFIQGMSQIGNFWGFPKAMGAIYGAVYLSPNPISLNEIMEHVRVTKGAVSTNIRQLERLGMVHKHIEIGERKDYYIAEIDFWKIVRGILKERDQHEFDKALNAVGESLEMTTQSEKEDPDLAAFYRERMGGMQTFFKALDNLVAAILTLEGLVSLSALRNMIDKSNK